jgi:tetratricopeptide (TPR) repeat protein
MRDYLQITYRTQEALLYEQVHKYLFTHYDQALSALTSARELTDLHGEALLQGIYHLEQYEYQQYPYWLSQYTKFFYRAGYYALLDNPLERALITLREIGDKAGEGATLNNISQIYDARGDYDTALTYLQQSLSIRQQIGDKAGEGTTLNNMATTAYARGDYDTALTYLQQSLSIRQQIGDKAGLCATLFNTGRLHWQNEATEQAIGSWVTVYVIAKQINLAQALAALEELAEQLDLPNGLEGWEALAEKLKTASELSLP